MNSRRAAVAVAVIVGALIPIISHRAQVSSFPVWALVALLIGSISGWLAPNRFVECGIATVAGLFVGVSLDAGVDIYYFGNQRNLFPMEWFLWAAMLAPLAAFASWVVGMLRQRGKRKAGTGAV